MKNLIITIVIIIAVGIGGYFLMKYLSPNDAPREGQTNEQGNQNAPQTRGAESVLGASVEGRDIKAYHFGTGDTELLFIGGVHGGYSWNTNLVAYELMDYLKANANVIPANVMVTVIPTLNPDGLYKVAGTAERFVASDVSSSQTVRVSGRFNAHNVDLNRNFDCDWKSVGLWQTTSVGGGTSPFSEPESAALKNYVERYAPDAVVVWYSAAGGVFASSCGNGILPQTTAMANTYSKASGYPAYDNFDFYETSGDMVNWLAKNNIPAISVLLSNHTSTEWAKNQAGVKALLEAYAQ